MADALDQLKERLTETQDLGKIARLLAWDQNVMMPLAGGQHRAEQFGALVKVAFEKFTDPAVGKLLDELGRPACEKSVASRPHVRLEPWSAGLPVLGETAPDLPHRPELRRTLHVDTYGDEHGASVIVLRPDCGMRPGGFEPPTRGLEVRCSVP